MPADKQALDALYKDVYENEVIEGLNQKNPLKDLVKFVDHPFGGREIVRSVHVGRNVSPMFSGEGGGFADAGQQTHANVRIGQAKMTARVDMTEESMLDSLKTEFAFKQARTSEMKGIIDDVSRREEHAL